MNFTRDKFWGFVLIALGVAALWFQPFDKIGDKLKGQPDQFLTLTLWGLALVAVLIAVKGDAKLKALAIFWIVSP